MALTAVRNAYSRCSIRPSTHDAHRPRHRPDPRRRFAPTEPAEPPEPYGCTHADEPGIDPTNSLYGRRVAE